MKSSLKADLLHALSQKGERTATAYLKLNPEIVVYSFASTPGHTCHVLNEFPLGSEFRTDFVLITSDSSGFEVRFIELENTDDKVITKDGLPSNRLNKAISQIGDWRGYVDRNQRSLRDDLTRWCLKKDILKWRKASSEIMNDAGYKLSDINTYIKYSYYIVIGRREKITLEKREKMNQNRQFDLTINSFDKFVDIADNFDRSINGKSSILLTETRGC